MFHIEGTNVKMMYSGIQVNFLLDEELLRGNFKKSEISDFRAYKDKMYFALAKKASAYGWIITVLTAASPDMDFSYYGTKKEPIQLDRFF